MPKEVVTAPTENQQVVYDLIKQFENVLDVFIRDERYAHYCDDIGIVHGRHRVLNGRHYPIFKTAVDYTRFLRYGMSFDAHLQHDIDVWYETIHTASKPIVQHLMLRLLVVLRYNRFVWKPGIAHGSIESWGDPNDAGRPYAWNLASSLSHGSRISIVVPKATHDGFRKWLTCGAMGYGNSLVYHRWFGVSTHSGKPVWTDHGADVDEAKGASTGAYGLDIGMGAVGQPSPIDGRVITEDGSCGHLLFYESNVTNLGSLFSPKKYKIIMIGIEASGPSGSAPDLYGSSHGTGGEQNGTGVSVYWHKNDGANNYVGMDSLPGGNIQARDVPAKYGGMVVQITASMDELKGLYQRSRSMGRVRELLEYVPASDGTRTGVSLDDWVVVGSHDPVLLGSESDEDS